MQKRNNKVIITIYEEPCISNMLQKSSIANQTQRRTRSSALGYDRKALLLAYSQQLRKSNTKAISRPNWIEWKAAFKDRSHCMRSGSSRRKFRFWMYRTVTCLKRREWSYYRMNKDDERHVNVSEVSPFLLPLFIPHCKKNLGFFPSSFSQDCLIATAGPHLRRCRHRQISSHIFLHTLLCDSEATRHRRPSSHFLFVIESVCVARLTKQLFLWLVRLGKALKISTIWISRLANLDKVCILGCSISSGLGVVLNVAKPAKGSLVVVFGLGAIGLAAADCLRISGASRIIGVDVNLRKFNQGSRTAIISTEQ
ncbi:uncharacterized protein LOC120263061 [Dioscorea cayenensis subsp. rotundata]|uniref:alcohol dehydrogenase n=1 Tax=Dioscorea cayennensis subsp. rotundata TaxID=55577 RepID=A0AB40BHP7_DIOCR|nr:uncharacterized protein LOC120263061 [Dioscorea cayenensis subsp. rotundata]